MKKIDYLQKWIDESNRIVIFSGAGVSTSSGIKDFRSKDGLYNMNYKYKPETILSHTFFENNTKEFFIFYKKYMNTLKYKPNIIHKYLFNLEKENKISKIITQNIDNLHCLAGNKNILELHGNVNRNYCIKCHKFYDGEYVFNSKNIPKCSCGGIIKPDVVLYEEPLDDKIIDETINTISNCDLLLIIGTSLTVYPANNLIKFYKGTRMVIINNEKTQLDNKASLVINDDLESIFKQLV